MSALSVDLDFERFLARVSVPRALKEKFIVPASVVVMREFDAETDRLRAQLAEREMA